VVAIRSSCVFRMQLVSEINIHHCRSFKIIIIIIIIIILSQNTCMVPCVISLRYYVWTLCVCCCSDLDYRPPEGHLVCSKQICREAAPSSEDRDFCSHQPCYY